MCLDALPMRQGLGSGTELNTPPPRHVSKAIERYIFVALTTFDLDPCPPSIALCFFMRQGTDVIYKGFFQSQFA